MLFGLESSLVKLCRPGCILETKPLPWMGGLPLAGPAGGSDSSGRPGPMVGDIGHPSRLTAAKGCITDTRFISCKRATQWARELR